MAGCDRPSVARRMCGKHYRSWLDRTPPSEREPAPRFQRDFWAFVAKRHTHGCWRWTGPTDPSGYGRWSKIFAHRHSWTLAHGAIPTGMWVLHHCDNKPCVNPAHLYLGTVVENTQDAVERGRNYRPPRKTHCASGHEISGDNLRVVRSKRGEKHICRMCDNVRSGDRQRAARAARGLQKTRLSDDERTRIRTMRDAGALQREIAATLGRGIATVRRHLREMAT